MSIRRSIRVGVLAATVSLAAVILSGCLVADKTVLLKYDKAADEFSFLIVYQRIAAAPKDGKYDPEPDLAWLKQLYLNRDHLILSPQGSPFPMEDWGENAFLRLSPTRVAEVSLSSLSGTLESADSLVPLDQVQVRPGTFFVRDGGSLCYFHQLIVPGKVVDTLLQKLPQADDVWAELLKAVEAELDRREQGGEKPAWDEYQKTWLRKMEAQLDREFAGREVEEPETPLGLPLEIASLVELQKSLSKHQVSLRRRGAEVYMQLPLTAADAAGAMTFFEAMAHGLGQKLQQVQPKSPEAARMIKAQRKLLAALNAAVVNQNTLELSADLVKLFQAFDRPLDPLRERPQEHLDHAAEMARLAGERLPVNREIKLEKIVADFQAGKLQAFPSDKPVAPGTGLGQIRQ